MCPSILRHVHKKINSRNLLINHRLIEASEVVPFFRAVRRKGKGCEATPLRGGKAPPSRGLALLPGSKAPSSYIHSCWGLASVRGFFVYKLLKTSTDLDETWHEATLG